MVQNTKKMVLIHDQNRFPTGIKSSETDKTSSVSGQLSWIMNRQNKSNSCLAFSWFKYWLKGPNQPQKTFDMFYSIFSWFQISTSLFPIPPRIPLKLTPKLNSEDSAGTQKVSTFLVDTFLVPMLTFVEYLFDRFVGWYFLSPNIDTFWQF